MISNEYRSTVNSKNILRTRIMLKDSMILDPTFSQFNEMLAYARQIIPEVIVPFDGGVLEEDSTKWSRQVVDTELVQVVNNFSMTRVDHLKKVISLIFADEIKQRNVRKTASNDTMNHHTSSGKSDILKRNERIKALGGIRKAYMDMGKVIDAVTLNGNKWSSADVHDMEIALRDMEEKIRKYKENK